MTSIAYYPDLEGKKVLVTGASSGIGLATSKAFLRQGARVATQYCRHRSPIATLQELFPSCAFPVEADLSTEEGCIYAIREALGHLRGLDVLVHCAGIWNAGPIREITRQNLEAIFSINAFSCYYLAREASRVMKAGNLVFIGSTAGQRGEPGHSHYAGSKGAVQSLVYSIAQELAPSIRTNLVSPGWVRTPMAEKTIEEKEEAIVATVPLRRVAEVDDIVAAVLFLESDVSRHLTGVDLCCSGGALLPLPRG
jgi:3-oxoacyl-[acyl-carrier protein] reductase